MQETIMLTEAEQAKYRAEMRHIIGLLSRLEGAGKTDAERTLWGCNRSYMQGILRQFVAVTQGKELKYGRFENDTTV